MKQNPSHMVVLPHDAESLHDVSIENGDIVKFIDRETDREIRVGWS